MVDETAALRPSGAPPDWFEDRHEIEAAVDESIRSELAAILEVDTGRVTPHGTAPVIFRDTALGCPDPSELVTGAEIRGWIAYFSVEGQLYRVHGSESGEFRLCDLPDLDVIPELDR